MSQGPDLPDSQSFRFETTHWSWVARVATERSTERRTSLEWLCRQYWNPIYAFLRRVYRLDPASAEDRTQEFFAYLIEAEIIERADPVRGRFRTYIKAVLRKFLSSKNRDESRQKRGGGREPVSLDERIPEGSAEVSPEEMLDREWARRVLEMSREELFQRLREEGRARSIEIFEAYTETADGSTPTYRGLSKQFAVSEWQIWKELSSVREELRNTMRQHVAQTVETPEEVEDEMTLLLSLLP